MSAVGVVGAGRVGVVLAAALQRAGYEIAAVATKNHRVRARRMLGRVPIRPPREVAAVAGHRENGEERRPGGRGRAHAAPEIGDPEMGREHGVNARREQGGPEDGGGGAPGQGACQHGRVEGEPRDRQPGSRGAAGAASPGARRRPTRESGLGGEREPERRPCPAHRVTPKSAVRSLGKRARATAAMTQMPAMSHSPRLTPLPITP